MARSYYKGHDTYVIYGEETSFGSGASPSGSNDIGKVQSITINQANNQIRTSGVGDGRNATDTLLGAFDINGTIDFQVNDFTALQYAIGTLQGGGVVADPFELVELENFGYAGATEIPTLELEIGSEGGSNDFKRNITGVHFNSLTLTMNQGELMTGSLEFIGKTISTGTSLTTYNPGTEKPFVFQEGSVVIGSDTVANVTSFQLTVANNVQTFRSLGDRFIQPGVTGQRRYDFSMNVRFSFNDEASTLSGIELLELFFGAAAATSPETGGTATSTTLSLDITEGAGTGDRVVNIDLAEVYFESFSEPINLDGGVIEVSVNGYAQQGLADGADNVPIRYYTIA